MTWCGRWLRLVRGEDLKRKAALQIGVIAELASGRRIRPAEVERFSIIFDDAAQERLQGLRQ